MDALQKSQRTLSVSRFAKHFVLITLALITMVTLFFTYATYAFRRDLEDQIATIDKGQTVESILYDTIVLNDQLKELENIRCAQRDAIAFFRLAAYPYRVQLNKLYVATWDARADLKRYLLEHKMVDLKRLDGELSKIWSVPIAAEIPLLSHTTAGEKSIFAEEYGKRTEEIYSKLTDTLYKVSLKEIDDKITDNANYQKGEYAKRFKLLNDQLNLLASVDEEIFKVTSVDALEARAHNLRKESDDLVKKFEKWKNLFAQKWIVESVFRNEVSHDDLKKRLPADPRTNGLSLGAVDCSDSEAEILRYAAARLQRFADVLKLDGAEKKTFEVLVTRINELGAYRPSKAEPTSKSWFVEILTRYMFLPATIQALFVTILFGFLGGLTVNLLRLSYVGYWGLSPEPDWGDVVISPIAGAVAATIIYLVAAFALPAVTETRGSAISPVSAALVGFLGFVSGFLNREAFAQVKIVGLRLLGRKDDTAVGADASALDVELAGVLRRIGATRFADLLLIHGAAEHLSKSSGLQILIPANAYFESLSAAEWFDLSSGDKRAKFLQLLDDVTLVGVQSLGAVVDQAQVATAAGPVFTANVDATKSPREVVLGKAMFRPLDALIWRGRELVIATAKP